MHKGGADRAVDTRAKKVRSVLDAQFVAGNFFNGPALTIYRDDRLIGVEGPGTSGRLRIAGITFRSTFIVVDFAVCFKDGDGHRHLGTQTGQAHR